MRFFIPLACIRQILCIAPFSHFLGCCFSLVTGQVALPGWMSKLPSKLRCPRWNGSSTSKRGQMMLRPAKSALQVISIKSFETTEAKRVLRDIERHGPCMHVRLDGGVSMPKDHRCGRTVLPRDRQAIFGPRTFLLTRRASGLHLKAAVLFLGGLFVALR